jgi:hypothetical protein
MKGLLAWHIYSSVSLLCCSLQLLKYTGQLDASQLIEERLCRRILKQACLKHTFLSFAAGHRLTAIKRYSGFSRELSALQLFSRHRHPHQLLSEF